MIKSIYLKDTFYDEQQINKTRNTVRIIITNDQNELGYLRIIGNDDFGPRNHLESVGGGIEKNELPEDAVHRELLEELGCTCEIITYLGQVIHDFNILGLRTYANYYYVRLKRTGLMTRRTALENRLIKDVEWYSLEKVREILESRTSKIGMLVHKRELIGIELYEKYLNELGTYNE